MLEEVREESEGANMDKVVLLWMAVMELVVELLVLLLYCCF